MRSVSFWGERSPLGLSFLVVIGEAGVKKEDREEALGQGILSFKLLMGEGGSVHLFREALKSCGNLREGSLVLEV